MLNDKPLSGNSYLIGRFAQNINDCYGNLLNFIILTISVCRSRFRNAICTSTYAQFHFSPDNKLKFFYWVNKTRLCSEATKFREDFWPMSNAQAEKCCWWHSLSLLRMLEEFRSICYFLSRNRFYCAKIQPFLVRNSRCIVSNNNIYHTVMLKCLKPTHYI